MEKFKTEQEVAQAVLDKAKKMLDEYLQKKEEFKAPEIKAPNATTEQVGKALSNKASGVKEQAVKAPAVAPESLNLKKTEKLRSFLAKKSQKRLAKCGEQKKV